MPRQVAAYLLAGATPRMMRAVISRWPHPGDYESAWRTQPGRLRAEDLPAPPPPFTVPAGMWLALAGTPEYPAQLAQAPSAPLLLFGRGNPRALSPGLAVVGTREMTAYGKAVVETAVAAAADAGVPVCSGGARGVDTAAAHAALEAGIPTVVVLATGADVAYPQENAALFEAVLAGGGAVISEHPFGTGTDQPGRAPLAARLQARNRIIAGLSMVTVAAEATPGSGTLGCVWSTLAMGRTLVVGLPRSGAGNLPGAVVPRALAAPEPRTREQLKAMGAPASVADAWQGRFPLAAGAHDRAELQAAVTFAVAMSPHYRAAYPPRVSQALGPAA